MLFTLDLKPSSRVVPSFRHTCPNYAFTNARNTKVLTNRTFSFNSLCDFNHLVLSNLRKLEVNINFPCWKIIDVKHVRDCCTFNLIAFNVNPLKITISECKLDSKYNKHLRKFAYSNALLNSLSTPLTKHRNLIKIGSVIKSHGAKCLEKLIFMVHHVQHKASVVLSK